MYCSFELSADTLTWTGQGSYQIPPLIMQCFFEGDGFPPCELYILDRLDCFSVHKSFTSPFQSTFDHILRLCLIHQPASCLHTKTLRHPPQAKVSSTQPHLKALMLTKP